MHNENYGKLCIYFQFRELKLYFTVLKRFDKDNFYNYPFKVENFRNYRNLFDLFPLFANEYLL